VEESSADALYHLGLLYLGQLYYREAWKVLERVIGSRPRMAPAFRAASIALVQLGDYEKAIECAKNAFQIDGDPLCTLVMAAALFLLGNSREAERVLALLPRGEKTFESPKHVQLYHRLCAFAALKSSSHDSAAEHFSKVLQALKREEDEGKKGHGPGIYNQFGRIENGEETPRGAGGASPKTKGMDGELVRDFFRLKEVIRDDERLSGIGLSRPVRPGAGSAGVQGADSTGTFLDLEGLSRLTWAALDLGFSLVRAGRLARARAVFEELSRSNPEVIGVRRVIELIGEKEAEQAEGKSPALGDIREKTDRVIEKKKRRYELWEYVERWEENAIRPHHLMAASGLAARRRLNPSILFPGSHSG
jgi:tetratricopeptide (TPR) repeat protein